MIARVPVDVRSLLAWTNHRIVELRTAIRHRHDDLPWWEARGMTPGYAQAGRAILRRVANLLHVERATLRGRIHGHFESLDKQREWLAQWEKHRCGTASRYLQLVDNPNLVDLRDGRVVQERDEPMRTDGMEPAADEVQS